jgi:DNA gyrase subunit A
MSSFKTEFKRKKPRNAFNDESPLIFIERIDNDADLVAMSSIRKIILFSTSQINPVESRTTKGVQVMKQKDGSKMVSVMRAEQAKLADPEFYRKGLNVIGFYLKKGDEIA